VIVNITPPSNVGTTPHSHTPNRTEMSQYVISVLIISCNINVAQIMNLAQLLISWNMIYAKQYSFLEVISKHPNNTTSSSKHFYITGKFSKLRRDNTAFHSNYSPIVCRIWIHRADPVVWKHSPNCVGRERQNSPLETEICE